LGIGVHFASFVALHSAKPKADWMIPKKRPMVIGNSMVDRRAARLVLGLRPDDGSTPNIIGAVTVALRRAESQARP